jgi:hypothetical protein
MPPAVEDLVHSVKVVVGEKNAATHTVEQSLVVCGREDGKLVAPRQMVYEGLRPPVLIFVQSVERLMQLFHLLHPRLTATSKKPTAFATAAKHAASAASGVVAAAVAAAALAATLASPAFTAALASATLIATRSTAIVATAIAAASLASA